MRHLLVIVLLTAFIPVSLLGYEGFAVLGIHSHCGCHCSSEYGPSSQAQQLACDFHHYDNNPKHHTVPAGITHAASGPISPKQSSEPSENSEECVLCQFFSYAKLQAVYTQPPTQVTHFVLQRIIFPEDIFAAFDCSLRPIPRGPPAIISS
tara:strand:- start:123 stop:575 length:453 start_codon:yes stop_codon:yes gene_type:complete